MLEYLPESEGNVLGVKGSGKLTDHDYREVYVPRLEDTVKEYGQVRLLFYMDESFAGWELGAMWDDAKYGMKYKDNFEKLAVVGGAKWIEVGVKLFSHFMKGEVKTFPAEQLAAAWDWLKA